MTRRFVSTGKPMLLLLLLLLMLLLLPESLKTRGG
jgi:hypothetical protein